MTGRFLKEDFILAIKIVLGFVFKKAAQWPGLCRELFFDPELPEERLMLYMRQLEVSTCAAYGRVLCG
jgi:hypothetical protein